MRIIMIIAFIYAGFSTRAQTDTIKWQSKSPLPSTARIDYASFVIDSNYYIIGGLDAGLDTYSEVWRYNIPTNTWQQMRDFPGGPVSEPVGFALNDKGYICCGIDSSSGWTKDNEFWEYYPVVDTWQHKLNYPGAPRETPVRFVFNQYAFVGMGYGPSATDLWRYNSISDNWDSVSSIPTGLNVGPGISVIDSFAYIFGGGNLTTLFNEIWRYNMKQDHWDSIGLMPGGLRQAPLCWTFDSTIIIGYGFIQDTINSTIGAIMANDIYSYNTQTNTWDTLACLNFPDSIADDGSGSFLLAKTAYFFGGFKTDYPNTSYYNNLWSFDASKYIHDTTTDIVNINTEPSFSVYPNPSHSLSFSISTSESGDVTFYDALGRVVDERKLKQGINQIKLAIDNEVVFYHATLQDGTTENGKVVFY